MVSIGDTLREARQRKGLSLTDVEQITKIRTHYLNALEEENFEELPGKTYVKGFIRTYAKAMELDPQELMDSYNLAAPDQEEAIKPIEPIGRVGQPLRIPRWLVIVGLCALAIITLFGVQSLSNKTPTSPPKPPKPTQTPAVSTTKPQVSTQPQQTPTRSPSNIPTTPTTATSSPLSMNINFTGDCWIVVKADGKQVLQGTFHAGTNKTVTANQSIDLDTVGSAGAISLTLNGKDLPSLGAKGQVVHNKIFTQGNIPQ